MKRKQQPCGIRVKHFQPHSKNSPNPNPTPTPTHYHHEDISSDPLKFSLSTLMTEPTHSHPLSSSLNFELITHIEALNQDILSLNKQLGQKDAILGALEEKLQRVEEGRKREQEELRRELQLKEVELVRRSEEVRRANEEVEHYRGELSSHIYDIKTQNKDMMSQLMKELNTYRQKDQRDTTYILSEHDRVLKALEQNSILNKHSQQNSYITKHAEQPSVHRQEPFFTEYLGENRCPMRSPDQMNKSPSGRKVRIQRAQFPESLRGVAKPVEDIQINKESGSMLSPLTADMDRFESQGHRRKHFWGHEISPSVRFQ